MIVNHLDKLFVTNDAATMLKEMDIIHPACKVLVLGSDQQQQEIGDSTNFVIVFAGELLQKAEALLKMGLTQTEISDGFSKACKKTLEELDSEPLKSFFLPALFPLNSSPSSPKCNKKPLSSRRSNPQSGRT